MEPGEIIDSNDAKQPIGVTEQYDDHDPEVEWPGEDIINPTYSQWPPQEAFGQQGPSEWHQMGCPPDNATSIARPPTILRLLVVTSSILPSTRRVVAPPLSFSDQSHELQFGRDRAPGETARVRLPELAVSKLHASIFWDETRSKWSIVDRGSKHGTFLHRDKENWRLSRPKEAGLPRTLVHGDTLKIGSTTFLVHVHDGVPCIRCTVQSPQEEIPVFNDASKSRKHNSTPSFGLTTAPREDPRKTMASLKRSLLNSQRSNGSATAAAAGATYVDRAARRRAMGASLMDAPGTNRTLAPVSTPSIEQGYLQGPAQPWEAPPQVTSSALPEALPTTNVGHQLLTKQGWKPGEVLGLPSDDHERNALLEPLALNQGAHRAGIGSHTRESKVLR